MVAHGASLDERLRHHGWTVTGTGCWEWNGAQRDGYGQLAVGQHRLGDPKNSVPMPSHRAAYLAWVGPIADGLMVRHRCDNRPCINPAHLELGSAADNAQDAVDRWRVANGERKSQAKLTDSQVREVRTRYALGGVSQAALAGEFGVSQQLVSHLVRGTRRRRPTNPAIR